MANYEYVIMKQVGDNKPIVVDEYRKYDDFWEAEAAAAEDRNNLNAGFTVRTLADIDRARQVLEDIAQTRYFVGGRPVAEFTETDKPLDE